MKEGLEKEVAEKDLVDIQPYVENSIEIAQQVKAVVLKIASTKIGYVEGFKQAQDCLSSQLNVPLELDMDEFIKELDRIGSLELKLLAIQSGNFSDDLKNKLREDTILNFNIKHEKTKKNQVNPLVEVLKKEVNRINRELGEQASPNVNEVKRIAPSKKENSK